MRWSAWLCALGSVSLVAVACGSDDEASQPGSGGSGANAGAGGNAAAAGQGGSSASAGTGATGGSGGGGAVDGGTPKTDPHVTGEYKKWHTLTFAFDGPSAKEDDSSPNPFLDHRLSVELTAPSGKKWTLYGFFAGDGKGAGSGNQWLVRFTPDEEGDYTYAVSFRSGANVSLSIAASDGSAAAPDGTTGAFSIVATDKPAPDFRGVGRLEYANSHYLRTQNGDVWIKGGADSPENFLGYSGFDNTVDQSGGVSTAGLTNGLHSYQPHVKDWQSGDPDWGGGKGKGIIGALNYLASESVNSIYFLPCNLGGDGRDTYPYLAPSDLTHLDISKLEQWETVFAHAEAKGVALHFVLHETETGNENLHDGGNLGNQRKLYYRELTARFGHHLALWWNIGEENDYGAAKQKSFAAYLRSVDAYDHPTTVHTHVNQPAAQYDPLVGDKNFELTSIQLAPTNADQYTETWRTKSAAAGRPWAVMLDEISPAGTGVTDTNAADIRKKTLWPALLSGAAGVEWYFGYHPLPLGGDMRAEDFRTRADMWRFTRHARSFLNGLPLNDMQPDDSLLGDAGGQVFYKTGDVYAVYLPNGGQTTLDLSKESGSFGLRWFDVAAGKFGAEKSITAGGSANLGVPEFSGDVAGLLRKK